MQSRKLLVSVTSLFLASVLMSGCANPTCSAPEGRITHVQSSVSSQPFELGPYSFDWRALVGVPDLSETWSVRPARSAPQGRMLGPASRELWFKQVYEHRGRASLSDFRLDFRHQIDDQDSIVGELDIDRFYPYRAHWSKHIEGQLGKAIPIELDADGHERVVLELKVSRIAEGS